MVSTFEFSENVVGILIDSDIDDVLLKEVHEIILKHLNSHEIINLFVEIQSGNKISLAALLKDINFKYQHSKRFSKIAVVTELIWFQNIMGIKDLVMEAEVRGFAPINRLEAMNWITQ